MEVAYATMINQFAVLLLLFAILYMLGIEHLPELERVYYFLLAGLTAPGLARFFMYMSVEKVGAAAGQSLISESIINKSLAQTANTTSLSISVNPYG